jgi:hypothetical protein
MTLTHNCALKFLRLKRIFIKRACPSLHNILIRGFFKCQTHVPPAHPEVDDKPLLAWVQLSLGSENTVVCNWIASWSDRVAAYTLLALQCPAFLSVEACPILSPAGRELTVFKTCDSLSIPIYAAFSDTVGPRTNGTIVKMQIQIIYDRIGFDRAIPQGRPQAPPPPSLEPLPLPPPPLPPLPPLTAISAPIPCHNCRYSLGIDFG